MPLQHLYITILALGIACTPISTRTQDNTSYTQRITGQVALYMLPHIAFAGQSVYKRLQYMYDVWIQDRLYTGVIHIHGDINNTDTYVAGLAEMCERNDIEAIMIDIDSGGGAAGSSQAIFDEIRRYKAAYHKPIIAWIENTCASGAYYIAAACDYIVASPSALVGSIGTLIPVWNVEQLLKQYNIHYEPIQCGTYKTTGDAYTQQQPHERDMLQALVDNNYQQFIADIQHARPQMAQEEPDMWADGKLFTGSQALELGLIDATGPRSTAENYLRAVTGRTGKLVYLTPDSEKLSLLGYARNIALSVTDHVMHNAHTLSPQA